MYTLIATAKLNNVDPQAWLADVLRRITDHAAGGWTSCCPGTGTRRRSRTPSPRKNPPLLVLQTFLQIIRR
jgi:IS66 C-terminal element